MELGLGADIFIYKGLFLGFRYRYNNGFRDILQIEASSSSEEEVNDYNLSSKGGYQTFMVSIGLRFN